MGVKNDASDLIFFDAGRGTIDQMKKLLELTELHCGATVDKLGENPFFTHDF